METVRVVNHETLMVISLIEAIKELKTENEKLKAETREKLFSLESKVDTFMKLRMVNDK